MEKIIAIQVGKETSYPRELKKVDNYTTNKDFLGMDAFYSCPV